MLDLPDEFLFSGPGQGGGVIQGTASEATLVALLSAKAKAVQDFKKSNTGDVKIFKTKLVAYASAQAHSSVERAGLLGKERLKCVYYKTSQEANQQVLSKDF